MSHRALKLCCLNTVVSLFNSTPARLVLFFIIAVTITLVISDNNAIADVLLQSPASPVEQPQQQPPPEQPVPAQPPAPAQPEAQPQANEPVTEIVSPISPVSPVSPAEVESQQSAPVLKPAAEPPAEPQPYQLRERDESADDETGGESNLILDQAELIDTVVVSTAYVWLCCGFILLLLIPLVFIFLQIRGRSKIQKEENF